MLKLKYLFENIELATEIIQQYDYDDVSYFKYYRISANGIYPYQYDHEVYFLRVTPQEEIHRSHLELELKLLTFLETNNYPCVRIQKSKTNDALLSITSKHGRHYASVFKRVPGEQIGDIPMTKDMAFAMGVSMGSLHVLTEKTDIKMDDIQDKINWMAHELLEAGDFVVTEHLTELQHQYNGLKHKNESIGIIHYDFEPDNLFYSDGVVYPIDFNDAMVHFYEMDIINALEDLDFKYH